MTFSPFDRRLLSEGLAFFDKPRLASLLEALGDTDFERTEALTAMLLNGSDEEIAQAVKIFERALERVDREQSRARDRDGRGQRSRRGRRD